MFSLLPSISVGQGVALGSGLVLLHVWPLISPPSLMLRCFVCYQCLCLLAPVWSMSKLDSWGVHMWGCVGRDLTLYPTGVPYICVWGFFYDGGVVSSPPARGVG